MTTPMATPCRQCGGTSFMPSHFVFCRSISRSIKTIVAATAYLICTSVTMATPSFPYSSSKAKSCLPATAVPLIPTLVPTSIPTQKLDCLTVPSSAVEVKDSSDQYLYCSSDSSDHSDECPLSAINIEELVTDTVKAAKKRKIERNTKLKQKSSKLKKVIPNAFIALPIKSSYIKKQIKELHNHLRQKEPKIENALIPLNRLHITLMVIKLDSEEDIMRATQALTQAIETFKRKPFQLTFSGLSSFGTGVLFADVIDKDKEMLQNIASHVRSTFEAHGIFSTDKRAFTAHMTVAKLSRQRKWYLKKITEDLYIDWTEAIGQESIEDIELLSMTKRDELGYYFCYAREKL